MQNVIIVPGTRPNKQVFLDAKLAPSCRSWHPSVTLELVKSGIPTQVLNFPNPYIPDTDYFEWVQVFKNFALDNDTVLIGQSAGAGFVLKYLSLNPDVTVGHLILIAPWLDLENSTPKFLQDFTLDENIPNRMGKTELFYSTDDEKNIIDSAEKIIEKFGDKMIIHKFSDRGHFWTGDTPSDFPELLKAIK